MPFRVSYRKTNHNVSEEDITAVLEPYFGRRENGGYFIGFYPPVGWYRLILNLHKKLVEENPTYYIIQVKEKFGGLRYYTGEMTEKGWGLVGAAEKKSSRTCERCGRAGRQTSRGYIATLCWWDLGAERVTKAIYDSGIRKQRKERERRKKNDI